MSEFSKNLKSNTKTEYSSVIFPKSSSIPEKLKRCRERDSVLEEILSDPFTADAFHSLNKDCREAFISFCTGNRGLNITYDPFFKSIFSPHKHPGRLDLLISSILGQTVTVKCLLSPARSLLSEGSSLMLMDILVETQDGTLIDVEMQKLGYRFPVERASCYASDIMVRQYDRLKEQLGNNFSYNNIKPVYVIVLMEESAPEFAGISHYMHKSSVSYDSGIKLNDMTKFIFISLDNFINMRHNKEKEDSEQLCGIAPLSMLEAWLLLFSSDSPRSVYALMEKDPVFGEIYRDIVNFQFHPKELIGMYSETLRLMDQNMIKFMIDEQKEILKKQEEEIETRQLEIEAQRLEIESQRFEIESQRLEIESQQLEIAQKDSEIAELKQQLEKLKNK